ARGRKATKEETAMTYWPLTDIQVLIAAILGLTLVLLVTLSFEKARVTRRDFARLQEDVKRLSDDMKTLQVAVLKLCIAKRELTEHDKTAITTPPLRSVQTGSSLKRPQLVLADRVKKRRLVSLGRYALRGVSHPQELFTLDPGSRGPQ